MQSQGASLDAFRPWPTVHLTVGVEEAVGIMIWRLWAEDSNLPNSQHKQLGNRPWWLNTTSATVSVPKPSDDETHSSPQRERPPTPHPSISELPVSLGLHNTLSSRSPLMAISYLNTKVGCLKTSLSCDCSLFPSSQSISVSNNRPSLKMAPRCSPLRLGE
jgi:hypothetical protein